MGIDGGMGVEGGWLDSESVDKAIRKYMALSRGEE